MKGISVIICCYNSGNKLIATLNHLAKQQIVPGIAYEVVIVDNNCTDNTNDTAKETWQSLGDPFPFVIVQQPVAGLSNAREKGIQTALYDYIILCDDDNWLCEDYLAKVYQLFDNTPAVALIGGVGEAVFETPAPKWFNELNGFGYAVGAESRKTGYVDSVYGAGMALRKTVFTSIINNEFSFILSDRSGAKLSSGGDTEICLLFKYKGYKIYFDSSLKFKHYISSNRLEWKYYLKLRRSFGNAMSYLQLYGEVNLTGKYPQESNKLKQILSCIKFAIWHFKYILFSSFFKNARCADFTQQLSMRLTSIINNSKMEEIAERLKANLKKEKQPLQYADKV